MTGLQWLLIIGGVAFLIWLWLRSRLKAKMPAQKGKEIVRMYEGFMVTWMPLHNQFASVRGENAMRVVYGRAYIYDDGYMESIPETFRMIYRLEGAHMQRRFDPYDDWMLLKRYQRVQGGREVPFVDGTETYMANLMGQHSAHVPTPPKPQNKIRSALNVLFG